MVDLTDQVLMAYVDGELDPDTARQVAAALPEDSEASALVSAFEETALVARQAFDRPLRESPPPRLLAALGLDGETQAPETQVPESAHVIPFRRRSNTAAGATRPRHWITAIAASLALVLGLGAGFEIDRVTAPAQIAGAELSPVHLASNRGLLQRALEHGASGSTETWQDAQTSRVATVTPVLTFQTAEGTFCREFQATSTGGAGARAQVESGVACRESDGNWRTRVIAAGPDIAGGDGGDYLPAAAPRADAVLGAVVDTLMAGTPLDKSGEDAARAKAWRP